MTVSINHIKMSTTLVTCFFDTNVYRSDNTGAKSGYWDETVLRTKHPMVIYGDKAYIEFAKSIRSENTEYHEMEISDIPLWSYYEQVETNRSKCWPSVDSRCPTSVHLITCSKILLVADTIRRNPFKTSKFGFIDCNVLKKMHITSEFLDTILDHEVTKFHIMAIGVVDDKLSYTDLYLRYRYVLSGGFFLCTEEHGLKVAELFKQEFIKTTDAGYGHGEEMIYTKLLNPHWDLFELSYGDYSECVTNIFQINRNHEYILNYCILPYSQHSWHKQLKYCCSKMLESNIDGRLRFKTLYYCYIANYWLHDGTGVNETLKTMSELTKSNIQALSEYKRDKSFYDTNLAYASIYGPVPSLIHQTLCVAIPCYKPHLADLNKLLDSVRNQTRKPDQVIIVTSESQVMDVKDTVLDEGWILCLKPDFANASMNRNLLAKLSNCDIISFIDADDLMDERRCEYVMQAFEDPSVDVVFHNFRFMNEQFIIDVNSKDIKLEYKYGYLIPETHQCIHNGHISLKRSIFETMGYDPNMKLGEDVDFNVRLYKQGYKLKYLPQKLSIYNKQSNRTLYAKLVGGMGNQLFIILKTMYEAMRTGSNYYLIPDEKTKPYINTLYSKLKDRFVDPEVASGCVTYKEKQWSYYDASLEIDLCFMLYDKVVLDGYWQSEKHFPGMANKLKEMLVLDDNFEVDKDACLIMVRRGDYLKYADVHNPCNLEYYLKAIELMKDKGVMQFYCTSDDLEWCKQNLPNMNYIEIDDVETLKQAIKFQYFIISNSTFHWFATYLANEVVNIIAPDEWIRLPNTDYHSIYTDKMTVISR